MRTITERQKEVLTFIADFSDENQFPPTVREISDHFKISLRAVQDHLAALQKKGYLTTEQKRSRSIRILVDERKRDDKIFMGKVPLLGTVAAG